MSTPIVLRALAVGAVLASGLAGWPASAAASARAGGGVSLNRAGYVVVADSVREIRASWAEPTAHCGHGASFADVEITLSRGRHPLAVGTSVDCHAGTPSYYAWVKFGAGRQKFDDPVAAGDVIRASVEATKTGVEFGIVDTTQRWGEGGASGGGHAPHFTRASALVAARTGEAGVLPLTDFGVAHFHAVKVDKTPFGVQHPVRVLMRTRGGVVKAVPGAIRDDLGFPVSWKHA